MPVVRLFYPEWPPLPPTPRPLFYGRGGRRAQPPVGEGSGLHHKSGAAHFLVSFRAKRRIPAPSVNDITLRRVLHFESQIFNSIA